jgi:hypothetical protein
MRLVFSDDLYTSTPECHPAFFCSAETELVWEESLVFSPILISPILHTDG